MIQQIEIIQSASNTTVGESPVYVLNFIKALQDSAGEILKGEPMPVSDLYLSKEGFGENNLKKLLSQPNSVEKRVVLNNLITRSQLLEFELTKTLTLKHTGISFVRMRLEPIISAKTYAPRIGDTFEADIFIGGKYCENFEIRQIQVNGKPFPVKEGMAHFFEHCSTSGVKKRNIEISVFMNDVEGIRTFSKDFEYCVLKACCN
ncbi:MAG: hypothetical protein IPL65_05070 [Lewinellaceae bacterium]|nr:hypothetical protein [Lewinellaceae bacterium]